MAWYDIFNFSKKSEASKASKLSKVISADNKRQQVLADYPGLTYKNITSVSFNGEKNIGEVGPILNYELDYPALRARSWQAQLDSDIAQIAVKRLTNWTIGKGLKLQSEPVADVLKDEGITLDKKVFQKSVETRWHLFRKSKCDYAGLLNLNQLSKEAERQAIITGDVLVILRLIENQVTVQLVDGQQVMSPEYGSEWYPKSLPTGNRLIDGVEINSMGEHVAYYVKSYAVTGDMKDLFQYTFERIETKGAKSGLQMAYLYYGLKFRINNTRGIPLLSACIQKIAKLERYSEATLGQAEEAAKVSYQVVHHLNADGKAPFTKSIVNGYDVDRAESTNGSPITADGVQLKNEIQVTTQKTAFNNPPGSEIKILENKNPLYFKDFYEKNSNTLFAVLELPPNVAMSLYDDSYSASRAAIKDWGHTLDVKREDHAEGFLQPIFNLWLYVETLKSNIPAPGLTIATKKKNNLVLLAYQNVRFVGALVPHVDPVKEVTAARLMLGDAAKHLPLNDLEGVTEIVGGGDAIENLHQLSDELKLAEELDIKIQPVVQQVKNNSKSDESEA